MQPEPRNESFAALYAHYRPRLLRTCRRMLPNHPDEVEAISQEAFLRAWAAVDRYTDDRAFWPWVSTIARRLCIDYLRRTGRDDRIERRTRHQRPIAYVGPDEALAQAEDRRLLEHALRSLGARHRRLLRMHHVDGWSYEEIAAVDGVTVESVRSALKRARASLRASYQHLGEGLAALPGIAWARRGLERFLPWTARVVDVRPPAVAAVAMLLGAALHVAPSRAPASPSLAGSPPPAVQGASARGAAGEGTVVTAPRPHEAQVASTRGWQDGRQPDAGAGEAAMDYRLDHVAVAPNDEVYAYGEAENGERKERVLMRSKDGGRTWERLGAVGFLGGRLLFPPAYPADNRIFATTPWNGIAVSKDGGATFVPLSTVIGLAAMSPEFSNGHEVFLSGNAQGWFFDASRMVTTPSGLTFPPSASWSNFAFGPRHADDGTVYVGGDTVVQQLVTTGLRAVLYACRPSGCTEVARGESYDHSAPEIVVSQRDGVVWAYATQSLWRSRDGSTFERLPLPSSAAPNGIVTSGGATYLAMRPRFGEGGLFRSLDGGDTWQELLPGRFRWGTMAMAVQANGTLFVAATPREGGGLLRSTDRGTTWERVL